LRALPHAIRRPTGFSPGQNRLAIVSFTTITGSDVAVSSSPNGRPGVNVEGLEVLSKNPVVRNDVRKARRRRGRHLDREGSALSNRQRQIGRGTRCRHPWKLSDALEQLYVERPHVAALRIGRGRKARRERNHVLGAESGIGRKQPREASNEKPAGRQQYEGAGELRRHESAENAALTRAGAAGPRASFLQRRTRVASRRLPRGKHAAHDRCDGGDAQREHEYLRVERYFGRARQLDRRGEEKRARPPPREREASCCADRASRRTSTAA
jgi:hypothetical protein